jgi:hypothetical protein
VPRAGTRPAVNCSDDANVLAWRHEIWSGTPGHDGYTLGTEPCVQSEWSGLRTFAGLGVGECAHGPTAAAIANAVYDALGVRVRSLPLTAEQLIAAMPD